MAGLQKSFIAISHLKTTMFFSSGIMMLLEKKKVIDQNVRINDILLCNYLILIMTSYRSDFTPMQKNPSYKRISIDESFKCNFCQQFHILNNIVHKNITNYKVLKYSMW